MTTRIIVYKQAPLRGTDQARKDMRAEPLIDIGRFVCEIETGAPGRPLRLFGKTIERLANLVSLNIRDSGYEIRNVPRGPAYDVRDNPLATEALGEEELVKFKEFLREKTVPRGRIKNRGKRQEGGG